MDVVLHTFRRPTPPSIAIQALAYLVKQDLAHGPIPPEKNPGEPADIPAHLCLNMMSKEKKGPTREEVGVGPRGEYLGYDDDMIEHERRKFSEFKVSDFPFGEKTK